MGRISDLSFIFFLFFSLSGSKLSIGENGTREEPAVESGRMGGYLLLDEY
ncbi:MAG: hypothetical protein ACYS17_13095 [Planctomycetota bacterium]